MIKKIILKIRELNLINKLENTIYLNRELKTEDFNKLVEIKKELRNKDYFYVKYDNREIIKFPFFKSYLLEIHRISWKDFVKSK
jgi:hypothetical protein